MSKPKIFELAPAQKAVVEELTTFLSAPYVADPFYVLSGPAGCGKTTVIKEVNKAYSQSAGSLAFTATTNKAAKVLRGMTGTASTIYSLLGLRMSANGEIKELAQSEREVDLSNFDGVVVDEAGMTNRQLLSAIRHKAIEANLRFVFSGDPFQLPPVGEAESLVWKLPQRASLTEVMRHDNQILRLVTGIRTAMSQPIMNVDIRSDNDGKEGVWKINKADFKRKIFEDAEAGKFADTNSTKIIAWRNVKTQEYNGLVRKAIFGAGAGFYEIGERIIAASPCMIGGEIALATDEEAFVEGIAESRHPLSPEFRTIELKVRTEDARVIRLTTLHPASQMAYDNACQTLAHSAKVNGKLWKQFWALKELFHDVKYAYAITAHRAQGSTYENVYVDYQDILMNRERREAFQCLYVATSRPTTKLFLA